MYSSRARCHTFVSEWFKHSDEFWGVVEVVSLFVVIVRHVGFRGGAETGKFGTSTDATGYVSEWQVTLFTSLRLGMVGVHVVFRIVSGTPLFVRVFLDMGARLVVHGPRQLSFAIRFGIFICQPFMRFC